jgi:hypothetical protein
MTLRRVERVSRFSSGATLDENKLHQTNKFGNWVLVEDQISKMKWSIFTRRQCEMEGERVHSIQ